jgi:hypothetical protein
MVCRTLERILDRDWLRNHPNHTYNLWTKEREGCRENQFLNKLEDYLQKLSPLLKTRHLRSKLRSNFVDTYYELEVGCSLINYGIKVDFEHKLPIENGNTRTPDIFIPDENTIVEVKTLHQSNELEKGLKTGGFFQLHEANRVKDRILAELSKYFGIELKHPLVLIICNDIIRPTILSTDDLETVLLYRINRGIFAHREFHLANDSNYEGLYFADNGLQANILSGVGLWRGRFLRFYENPNANKESRIPQGKLSDFLKRD